MLVIPEPQQYIDTINLRVRMRHIQTLLQHTAALPVSLNLRDEIFGKRIGSWSLAGLPITVLWSLAFSQALRVVPAV